MKSTQPLRIGTLGAAKITPNALIKPAAKLDTVQVVAVAARDPARARDFSQKYGIPKVHDSYDALIDDPEIDAIYNPLPNSLHCEWSIWALRAGKHVLCEKPLASNASEAKEMKQAAAETGLVLVEAFHNLYHPLTQQVKRVIESDELGEIQHVEAHFNMPIPKFNDIRLVYELAGGAVMDLGCYPVGLLRYLIGEEPEVVSAQAKLHSAQIDQQMVAELQFPSGVTGKITCALFVPWRMNIQLKVIGSQGYIWALNPWLPHHFNWLTVQTPCTRINQFVRGYSTYQYQLEAFVKAVRGEEVIFTDGEFGVRNMTVLDEIYRRAGLKIRGAKLESLQSPEIL